MREKLTLEEFLSIYKNVDKVRGSDKQGTLFESICYLLENEPNNPKIKEALEKVVYNYVKIFEKNATYDNEMVTKQEISLLGVPVKVAEAINERAFHLKCLKQKQEMQNQEEIINLLKVDDEEIVR